MLGVVEEVEYLSKSGNVGWNVVGRITVVVLGVVVLVAFAVFEVTFVAFL